MASANICLPFWNSIFFFKPYQMSMFLYKSHCFDLWFCTSDLKHWIHKLAHRLSQKFTSSESWLTDWNIDVQISSKVENLVWLLNLQELLTATQIMHVFVGVCFAQNKKIHIHLYCIATKYLWNNALVEYIDNWTCSYSLIIIYRNNSK